MNGTVYRIWNTNTNRWVRSNNGLSMWQKLSGATNTINQNSYLKEHCVIKEFMIIPKNKIDPVIINDMDDVLSEEEVQFAWERFGKDFDEELSGKISNYDRDKITIVSTIYANNNLSTLYYVFLCEGIYYRITTRVYWRKDDRFVIPDSCVIVESKYQLAYKFIRKEN